MSPKRIGLLFQLAGTTAFLVGILTLTRTLTHLPTDIPTPQHINCVSNLKQIGLAFKTYQLDNNHYPFELSTNAGGTMEYSSVGPDGFDTNAVPHFQIISNELSTPKILVCPRDRTHRAAPNFAHLGASNISYRLRTATNMSAASPSAALAVCPADGNILHCDGTVTVTKPEPAPRRFWFLDPLAYHEPTSRRFVEAVTAALIGAVLIVVGRRLRAKR